MAKLLSRVASAVGIMALAVFFVGFIPFLSADLTAGAGLFTRTPAISVDRTFKGDRLPLAAETNAAFSRLSSNSRQYSQPNSPPRDIPVGCDAAFSPISAPQLALIYGRCLS